MAIGLPPYRLHLLERVVTEVPEIEVHAVFTHETAGSPWPFDPPASINPVLFGRGQTHAGLVSPRTFLTEWAKGGRIIRWMKQQAISAVVVMGYNDPARVRLIRWCYRQGVPCFLRADSNLRNESGSAWKLALKRWMVPRVLSWCSGVMPCGSLGKAFFEKYGVPPEKIFLCPFVSDLDKIQAITPETIDAVMARFGLSKARRRVVYSGRLVAHKRVDLLIDGFVSIAQRRPEWDVLIVGDGPMRQALQAKVPASLASRVTWTGFLDQQDTVSALYRACDVMVHPSDREPWALVIGEALAAGLAVISSDVVGAAADLVKPGGNGFVFPTGDLPTFTKQLLEATDPDRIDTMKSASATVLAQWRRDVDPVVGLKKALGSVGVIEADTHRV